MIFSDMNNDKDDRSKVEQLFNQYGSHMFRIAMSVLKDEMEAEDAVQESFVKIMGSLNKIGEISDKEMRAYLAVIVRNQALDQYRKLKKHPVAEDSEADQADEPSPEQMVIDDEIFQIHVQAIGRLDKRYRDVLQFKYLQNMENKQIAKLLNLSESAVYTRINRGKQLLLKQL